MDKQTFTELNKQAWKADHTLTGRCDVCGKDMWKRDVDFSVYKWNKVVCINCSPMTAKRTEEVKAEEKFLEEQGLDSIPF